MNAYIYLIASLMGFIHQKDPLLIKSYYSDQMINFIFSCLPKHGILRKDEQGLVYVKIDNNYIHQIVEFIKHEGFVPPPYFGEGKHGAHITVMTPEETLYYALGDIKECGRLIKFEPKNCQIVYPEAWGPGQQACLITVEAPALHHIREKYKIPQKKYEFHITVGVRCQK